MKRLHYMFTPVLLAGGFLVVIFSLLAQPTYAGQESDNPPYAPTAIGDLAYVTLSSDNLVALVDTTSHTITGTVDVGAAGCNFPWRATMSPDGAYVYVGCRYSDNVTIIETAGNTIVNTIDSIPSADGIAFTRDGAYALVGSRHDSQITIVDTATYFVTTISTPSNVRSIATHPYLDTAYATSGDDNVLVIDTTTFSITSSIPVGDDPHDVAVSPDGQWVFAGSRRGDGLAVIDAHSNTVHTTLTGLGDLTGLAVAPDGSVVYAGGLWNGVHVIDGMTFDHITTVPSPGKAWEAAVTCDGSELYVGNTESSVPVIDSGALWVTGQIIMPGSGARGIAICPQYVATGVVLSPPDQTNPGGRGQVVAHSGTLINVTGATDSFDLELGSHTWDTGLSTNSLGPIADNDSVTFTVYVTVPVDADWYSTDLVEVTATSVVSPTVYSDTTTFTTQAYAPPEISVSPDVLTSTQFVNDTVTKPLTISNGSGVTLTFEIGTGSGVSFFAASTELYGYDVPDAWLRVVGTQDDTHVQVINLDTSAVIGENTDLDRYETWDVYPDDGTFYKVEANKSVVGYESDLDWSSGWHNAFVPSLYTGPVGTEFIFFYGRDENMAIPTYVFAIENASVEVYDTSGSMVASQTLSAGEYWDLFLSNAVYHVISTGRIAIETAGVDGYTTVPSVEGNGIGRRFYFVTDGYFTGAFVVFAYQDADVDVYDLDSGLLLYSQNINEGDYWWQTDVGTRRLRLESTGNVEVWGGDAENGNQIENLGDDVSFAGGDGSREYYLHSLMDGSVIFTLFDNTQVNVDDTVHNLNKDEYLHLDGCCYYRHIQSNQPILIQTLGRDSSWNNLGTYLGGKLVGGGGLPPWLAADPISGTVSTDSSTPVNVTLDANGLQPGDYTVDITVRSNDPVTPLVSVPVTMTVMPTANMGWVEGTVTDVDTDDPLEATIIALGQPYTVTTESDTGYYQLWLDEGSYTIQVSAAGYVSETAVVGITAQQGITQDFGLVLNVPVLEVSPLSMEVTHDVGDVTMQEMTITNNGPAPLTFEIQEQEGDFTPAFIQLSEIQDTSGGPDAFGYTFRDSYEPDGPTYAWEEIDGTGTQVTGWTSTDDGYAGPIPIGFDFDYYGNTYTELFVGSNGYISFGQGYGTIPGGTLPQTGSPNNDIALFGNDMYLYSYGNDSVVYYQTLNNPTRFLLEFVNLYYCCGQNTPHTLQVILYPTGDILAQYQILNDTTTTYVGIENMDGTDGLSYGASLSDNLAICYTYPGNLPGCRAGDVPWLSTMPITGTVPAYSSTPIQVTFDATGVQPGVYTAWITVWGNDPVTPSVSVPVTMTVMPTPDMGRVTGAVSDAWTGLPLEATVELVGVYSTTASPNYTIWAPAGSYSLSAYTSGYYTGTWSVEIISGEVTVQDLALEPSQPRLEYAPPAVTATAVEGHESKQTFVISNTGPVPLEISLHEIDPTITLATLSPTDLSGKHILYDLYHGGPPSSEYSTLIDDLVSTGVVVIGNVAPITESSLAGYDVLWVNCCGYTSWTFAELTAVSNWMDTGGAVLIQGEDSPATRELADIFDITYQYGSCNSGTTTDIESHPISAGVSAIYVQDTCWYLDTSPNADIVIYDTQNQVHVVTQQENGGKVVVVASENFTDWYIDNDDNRLLANNIMAWLADPGYSDVPWLSETPTTGTVAGHSNLNVSLGFDATNLAIGEYQAILAIEHNDPAQSSPVQVPVTLTVVSQQASVSVSPASQQGHGFPGEKVIYTFTVTNEGNYTDTFSLDATGVWTAILSADTTGPLGTGESFAFTLEVTIPSTADPDSNDTTTITAQSAYDPAVVDTAQATTTAIVSRWDVYIPLVNR